jgi:hypothetical protein
MHWCGLSQSKPEVPLTLILKDISKAHQTKFSYIDEELVVYTLVPPAADLSLEQKLSYIEANTRLLFRRISDKIYSIYNDKRMDKPLCGYLIDAETGSGIENAEVRISNSAVVVASNAHGYFELPIVSPNEILIRHIGYEPATLDPTDLYTSECRKVKMNALITGLDEVVTRRFLTSGIYQSAHGELLVKPEKFGILPGLTEPDILQTLQQVPGVTSVEETISNINVRGGSHDQNLFLWNGIRMFQTGHFFGLISAFNPLQPTEITIFKNASPSFFGEAVSSTVAISTYSVIPERTSFTVAADMLSVNALSKVRLTEHAALMVSARRSYTDFFQTPTYRKYENRIFQNTIITEDGNVASVTSATDFYFYDYSLQYQQKIGRRHELVVDGIGIANEIDVDQREGLRQRRSNLSQNTLGGSFSWRSKWSVKHKSELQAYFSHYSLDALNESATAEQITNQLNTVIDRGVRLGHTFKMAGSSSIEAGYQFNMVSVTNEDIVTDPAFEQLSREILKSHSVFGEYHYSGTKTELRAGVRANYFQKYALTVVEPRISVSQKLAEHLRIVVAGEQKSQTMSQIIDRQRDFLGLEKRRWMLADEDQIPVQKSSQASLGFNYSDNRWLLSLDNYYKIVDGITTGAQGFQNQFEFVETHGKNTVLGSELLLQRNFNRFYTWISYGFMHSRYDFGELTPQTFPGNFEITHAVAFAATYEWKKLRVAIGSKWHSGRAYTGLESVVIDPNNTSNSAIAFGLPNNLSLPSYWQVNFSMSKTWNLDAHLLQISGSLLNITDRENIVNRFYRINPGNTGAEAVNIFGLGATPNVSARFTF